VQFYPEAAFYLPHTRFWELMIGSALAYILLFRKSEFDAQLTGMVFASRWQGRLSHIKACCGLTIIIVAFIVLNKDSIFPGWWALLPTSGTFLLISAGETAWINRKILSNRFLVFVGLISYPLYLWHWPLLSFVRIVLGDAPAWANLAAVAFAFPLAWMTYEFVEKPIRQGRTATTTRRTSAPLLVSAMLTVIFVASLSARGHLVPSRYPEALRDIAQYKADDHMPPWRKDKCFLTIDHNWNSFDQSCTDIEPPGAPLVFLWGDSHAADLYPGLHQLQSSFKFRLA